MKPAIRPLFFNLVRVCLCVSVANYFFNLTCAFLCEACQSEDESVANYKPSA
jgi:hypothetical protein